MDKDENCNKSKKLEIIFFILLGILLLEGVFIVRNHILDKKAYEKIHSMNDQELTAKIIDLAYIFDTPYTEEELKKYAPDEQFKLIGDDYAQYVTQDGFEKRINSLNLKFVGLGFHSLLVEEGYFEILEVLPNSPVEEAGLVEGDKILKIQGKSLENMSLLETINLLEEDEAKNCIFTIKRGEDIFDATITKRLITGKSVDAKMLDDNIGYMRLYKFSDNLSESFISNLSSLLSQNMTKLIIDLRGNGGGEVSQIAPIASSLLDNSIKNLFTIKYKIKDNKQYKREGDVMFSGPLVVLCNEETASASELLISILKDYDRCVTVGKKTYGKQVSQEIFDLNSTNKIFLSTGLPSSPKKGQWHKKGITPDYDIEIDKNNGDTQIKKALEILKG